MFTWIKRNLVLNFKCTWFLQMKQIFIRIPQLQMSNTSVSIMLYKYYITFRWCMKLTVFITDKWKCIKACTGRIIPQTLHEYSGRNEFINEAELEARLCVYRSYNAWWRHQMETFPRYWPFVRGIHRSPTQRPVTRSFDVFFDLRLK